MLAVALVARRLVGSRRQAETYIQLGLVKLNGHTVTKFNTQVLPHDRLEVVAEQFVSRAALKLASVCQLLDLDFQGKVVLDVGSSTGGFTQYALRCGARQVIAVDVGSNQLHPSLRLDHRIRLFEQTDIRDLYKLPARPHIVLADLSFVSLRAILPHIGKLGGPSTQFVIMVKPQFEASAAAKHQGVIKNDHVRRTILKDFEQWVQKLFVIQAKADSAVPGSKGNRERFYLLRKLPA